MTIRLHELSAEAQQDRETLLTLIRAFTYRHEQLSLEGREFPGLVEFKLRGAASDQGHLIGKKGSHAQALAFIAKKMGSANGTQYRLTVMEPEEGGRVEQEPRPWAEWVNVDPIMTIVDEILWGCDLRSCELSVKTEGTKPINLTITVHFRDQGEADRMTATDRNDLSLERALGTVLRAIFDKERVKGQLTVETA